MADMLNHQTDNNVEWTWSDSQNGFIMVANRDIPRGSEICGSYGKKCNSSLLLSYGFTVAENDSNTFRLYVPLFP